MVPRPRRATRVGRGPSQSDFAPVPEEAGRRGPGRRLMGRNRVNGALASESRFLIDMRLVPRILETAMFRVRRLGLGTA